jgi:hypothetical protein
MCAPISPVLSLIFAFCLLPFAFCLHSRLLPSLSAFIISPVDSLRRKVEYYGCSVRLPIHAGQ